MSTAQVLYLRYLITKKLRRDKKFPRQLLAHRNLQSRLQPLVAEVYSNITESQGALDQAIEEMNNWLGSENQGMLQGFEQKFMMTWNGEQLACLNLADEPAQTDRPQ
jgi:hypothetical protein